MASQGLFSIGGIASGLDTSNIIEQLLALERQPVQRLERQQEALSRTKDAWGQVNTKLSSLRSATDKINRVDRFDAFMSVTSSNTDAVSVTSSGTTKTGSLSFRVDQLAQAQQRSAGERFGSRTEALGDRGLQITAGGANHDFGPDELGPDATLDDLVKAINDAKIGVRATALQVAAGEFRLVLDATKTGEVNTFEATSIGTWDDGLFGETQEALDAQVAVGGITVTRSSNTITDLVDGATITLKKTTDTAVNVTAQRDVDGAVAAVKGFTDALNGVISTIADLTKYDPETREAGRLQGDASARRLVDNLRQSITRPLTGLTGADGLASSLGISFSRDGSLVVDEAKIRQAFTDDFASTAARFGRSGTASDPAALFLSATNATTPGTYDVQVTQAATVASATVEAYEPPGGGQERTIRLTRANGSFTEITLNETHASAADAAERIRQRLADEGVTAFDVSSSGGELRIATVAYGSAARFSVSEVGGGDAFGLAGTDYTGTDVAGTINGLAATGAGRTLTGATGDATGLSVRVTGMPRAGEPDEGQFTLDWTRGFVGELSRTLSQAEGINGIVSRARQAVDRQVEIYQTRIDGFEQRLVSREATIRRQFVGMETMLGQLNAQGNWLGQQLAGLSGGQAQ